MPPTVPKCLPSPRAAVQLRCRGPSPHRPRQRAYPRCPRDWARCRRLRWARSSSVRPSRRRSTAARARPACRLPPRRGGLVAVWRAKRPTRCSKPDRVCDRTGYRALGATLRRMRLMSTPNGARKPSPTRPVSPSWPTTMHRCIPTPVRVRPPRPSSQICTTNWPKPKPCKPSTGRVIPRWSWRSRRRSLTSRVKLVARPHGFSRRCSPRPPRSARP
ncbi:Uncharacterised protein [Mycobacteroides abscessus subsp. massiliense]|nr:Uncharacterised protein [Mycobacteroides abscessus subsp. massiliense]